MYSSQLLLLCTLLLCLEYVSTISADSTYSLLSVCILKVKLLLICHVTMHKTNMHGHVTMHKTNMHGAVTMPKTNMHGAVQCLSCIVSTTLYVCIYCIFFLEMDNK